MTRVLTSINIHGIIIMLLSQWIRSSSFSSAAAAAATATTVPYSKALLASQVQRLRAAESTLTRFATERFAPPGGVPCEIDAYDTEIPRRVVPLRSHDCRVHHHHHHQRHHSADDACYRMHALRATAGSRAPCAATVPLVFLHGYMNGCAYFYRNMAGLAPHFRSIYSVDLLGWGLSSRPHFRSLLRPTIECAEDFFVESLEAWRRANGIERMVLAGHSMGGYLSVAYCERYPQRVERLVLISPAGVTEESNEILQKRQDKYKWTKTKLGGGLYHKLFHNISLGDIIRSFPHSHGEQRILRYVRDRMHGIVDADEQHGIAQYLFLNNRLPGSGEYCVPKFLTPFVFGRKPTEHRIPRLRVAQVSFLYGSDDWMDATGGVRVARQCQRRLQSTPVPVIENYQVSNAGHLLMLDNWSEFNRAVLLATGQTPSIHDDDDDLWPKKMLLTEEDGEVEDEGSWQDDFSIAA